MSNHRPLLAWLSTPFLLAASSMGPAAPAAAQTWRIGVAPDQRAALSPWAYGDMVSDGSTPLPTPNGNGMPGPVPNPMATRPLTAEQLAQRCNTGRLVGGLLGGGLGYGLSRQDGRAWAIPLGALLGSQVGCSAAVGRGPIPW